jgi:16S rRNA (cytidine1402-2'-O)-methyltransferase
LKGKLILIPTPIDDVSLLEPVAKEQLLKAVASGDIICVEELKEGRQRWLRYGLPREAIENFVLYNEHTRKDILNDLIKKLKSGKNIFMMSDCGLPAFCDPGRLLVDKCHSTGIKVTATPFANSIALAIALSGFNHDKFMFEGFVSNKSGDRTKELRRILKNPIVSILMDTPYRMKKLVDELAAINPERVVFLGIELNQVHEKLIRGPLREVSKGLPKEKKEFIIVLGPGEYN